MCVCECVCISLFTKRNLFMCDVKDIHMDKDYAHSQKDHFEIRKKKDRLNYLTAVDVGSIIFEF